MKTCLIGNTALYITSLNVAEFDFLLPSFQNANAFRVVPTIPSMQADQNTMPRFPSMQADQNTMPRFPSMQADQNPMSRFPSIKTDQSPV